MTQPTWIGRTLSNRYRIDALLGQGGMSAVYKATDPNLRRTVAIKLIHPHLSGDAQFVNRFQEEAAAVAALNHPNIVQVYDFNEDNGVYYMVLSFIEGGTLQDLLNRLNREKRYLDIKHAIKYTIDVCDGLGYAHQRGMIHRDIKPANIMINQHDEAILTDFGIVKIVGSQGHTATGAVVGTARYMPPELVKSETPDARADIYSLGVTLYEMLSGRPPFVADSAVTLMMMHLNDPVPDPRSLRADVPQSLVDVLLKAMAKDREQRYHSAAEFAAALKAVQSDLETGASTPRVFTPSPAPAAASGPASGNTPPPPARPVTGSYTPPPATGALPKPPAKANRKALVPVLVLVFLCLCACLAGIYFAPTELWCALPLDWGSACP